jgi:O-antigen ligase
MPVLGALLALVLAFVMFKLHYTYGQAPHRIVKMMIGMVLVLFAFFKPKFAVHAWLLAIPIGEWLPSSGIPGLNGPNLLFIVLLLSWVVPRIMTGERIMVRTRIAGPLALFAGLLFLSAVHGILFPPGSGYQLVAMMKAAWQSVLGFSIYFIVANTVKDEKEIRSLLMTLAVGAILGGVIAVRQYLASGDATRIAGALGDVNDLAAYFAMVAVFLIPVATVPGTLSFIRRVVLLGAAGLATLTTFMPKSRGAYIGLGLAVLYLANRISKRALVVVLVVIALSPLWAPDSVKDRVAETRADDFEMHLVGDATDRLDPSSAVRLEIWGVVMREFVRSPIIGHGYASIPYLTSKEMDKPWSAHSLYVETAGEMGLVGLLALTWLFLSCAKSGRELMRVASSVLNKRLAIGFLAATVALLITNVFGQRLTHISIGGTYFFVAGLVDRCIYFERERRATEDAKGVLAA